ncbi:hypothetical protein COLO4_36449 [Corchorus olitorius]|uniref:Uncharacterized protein n=1 Tax=Corchorus olitorius TaxID=93759 RepID=A0A1R3G919_9ROSI|nr:hypothetical protein COLO4_36449 [Corchorus olitorius]
MLITSSNEANSNLTSHLSISFSGQATIPSLRFEIPAAKTSAFTHSKPLSSHFFHYSDTQSTSLKSRTLPKP